MTDEKNPAGVRLGGDPKGNSVTPCNKQYDRENGYDPETIRCLMHFSGSDSDLMSKSNGLSEPINLSTQTIESRVDDETKTE